MKAGISAPSSLPPAHAHRTGGAHWSREQKIQFANDLDNLIAIDDRTNQEKGDKGPVRWKPLQESYWCEYARRWWLVKRSYGLEVSERERRSLGVLGNGCE